MSEQESAAPSSQVPGNRGVRVAAAEGEPGRIARLEQQCARLANELSGVSQDADRRDREHQDRIAALLKRLHECETELWEKDSKLATLATRDAERALPPAEGAQAAAGTAAQRQKLIRSEDLIRRLKARLDERGRALTIAGEQISALHEERARLLDTIAERGRQVAQLLSQLTHGEVRQGFGMEFSSGVYQLLERDPSVATGVQALADWTPGDINEQTIVLDSSWDADVEQNNRRPAAASDEREAPRNAATKSAASSAPVRARGIRLRRYLLPVQTDVDPVFELTGPRSYVGRGIEADVCLTHSTISRLHGVLYWIGGATIVEDARSSNGVFVNHKRVRQAVLQDGDHIAFGNVAFQFRVALSDG